MIQPNPISFMVKKQLEQILKQETIKHLPAIERLSGTCFSTFDATDLNNLLAAIYRSGFDDAAKQYGELMYKYGYKVESKHPG